MYVSSSVVSGVHDFEHKVRELRFPEDTEDCRWDSLNIQIAGKHIRVSVAEWNYLLDRALEGHRAKTCNDYDNGKSR